LISTANITMQFGPEPLFENISAKFGNGNRYGLIGANGCGKSTFMKILSGALAPTSGNVSITPGLKVGTLSQDQFAFEQYTVIDAVIMGDTQLWKIKQERDAIYAKPDMSEEDGMRVGREPRWRNPHRSWYRRVFPLRSDVSGRARLETAGVISPSTVC